MAAIDLRGLQTEGRNLNSVAIDRVSTRELCEIINDADAVCSDAVRKCVPVIASAIDCLTQRVKAGGRVIYVGAGTSGRLGVLDASEIPPTFSAPASQFVGLIAGGDAAIRHAQEGAEDSWQGAERDMRDQNLHPDRDSLIGIAASGRTPYVLGCLDFAKRLGCATVGVACCEPSEMGSAGKVDFMIAPVTGPEVVTGSTRMKAGTATKLVLNMISTGVMIKLGKTYGNLMVDMKASNAKLIARSRRMIRTACGSAAPQSDGKLDSLLQDCSGSVKLAIAVLMLKLPVDECRSRLDAAGGGLAKVIQSQNARLGGNDAESHTSDLCLCVDGGGTKCQAVIVSPDGRMFEGQAGPCNITDNSIESGLAAIRDAVGKAIETLQEQHPKYQNRQLTYTMFASAWIGLAGYGRPQSVRAIDRALSSLLGLKIGAQLRVTNDIALHSAVMYSHQSIRSAIALISGTGSVAMSYERRDESVVCTARSGGWGYILGDAGSGFALGRDAIQCALQELYLVVDKDSLSSLSRKVIRHLGVKDFGNPASSSVLGAVLLADDKHASGESAKTRVASVAPVVLSEYNNSETARDIVRRGASALGDEVKRLLSISGVAANTATLVMGGGVLIKNELYRSLVLQYLKERGFDFRSVAVVDAPAHEGANVLRAASGQGRTMAKL